MASKREQLQSYQFLVQRMVSALVIRESDPEQPPFRRSRAAAIGSVVIAAIVTAVVFVYGLIVPGGNTSWQAGDVVIVEKGTGTRFVYLDERLHQVENYASALLAIGQHAETVRVSSNSLAGVPRGPRIGIDGAPDELPPAEQLLDGAWTMCSEPAEDESGSAVHEAVLLVGRTPPGGRAAGNAAMLVEVQRGGDDSDRYLIWGGYRHRVDEDDAEVVDLTLGTQPWTQVSQTFIDVLPAGEPISSIEQRDLGKRSRAIPDRPETRVGQLFAVETSGGQVQHYVAEEEQLRPITPFQLDIQLATPEVGKAYDGEAPFRIPLEATVAAEASRLPKKEKVEASRLPTSKPEFVGPSTSEGSVCARFGPGRSTPRLLVDPAMPAPDPMMQTARTAGTKTALADRVIVPPGHAVVVEAMASDTTPRGTYSVVTDIGHAHPLADPELLDVLGYAGVEPVRMPAWLVARIPLGSGLDPDAALGQP